jgi:Leucine-rich repeat (LRR) protein
MSMRCMMYHKLIIGFFHTIEEAFASIPDGVTTLDLSGNNLYLMSEAQLRGLKDVIPENVTTLNLSRNYLCLMSEAQLRVLKDVIPESVTTLNLSGNNLYLMSEEQLRVLKGLIPKNVTTLDLSGNGFCQMGEVLRPLKDTIPENVTTLNLSGNNLSQMSEAQLRSLKDVIPENVTTLDLSEIYLYSMREVQLRALKDAIPENVTTLNLSKNHLYRMSEAQLRALKDVIPENVTTLNLSGNGFCRMSEVQLRVLKDAIPENVTTLDLSKNHLFKMLVSQLRSLKDAIPENVTTLDLSGNNLNLMSAQNLRIMLESIPAHVTSINLQKNDLFKNKTPEEIDAFLKELGGVNLRGRLDLSHNGESPLARAGVVLAQMSTSGIPVMRHTDASDILNLYGTHAPKERVDELTIPPELTTNIASYLGGLSEKKIYEVIDNTSHAVETRKAHDATQLQKAHDAIQLQLQLQFQLKKAHDATQLQLKKAHDDIQLRKAHDAWAASWIQLACEMPCMPLMQATSFALSIAILLICSHVAMLTLSAGLMLLSVAGASKIIYDFASSLPGPEAFELGVTRPLLKAMHVLTDVTPPSYAEEPTSYLSDDGEEESKDDSRLTNKRHLFFLDEPGHARCFGGDATHNEGQLFLNYSLNYSTLLY